MLNDPRLVELCRSGDREAYRQIVGHYQGLICALAFSACGDVARSEDLAQETFLAAWQNLGRLHDPAKFKLWLCGIARNLIRDSQRKRSRRKQQSTSSLDVVADTVSDASTPPQEAILREEATIVRQALGALPEAYREPLVLFYREDQSVQNVAEALDLSEETVRQRLSRGRSMLREQLAAVVERSLERTKPGPALTVAIVASLPGLAGQAKAASVAIASAKGLSAAGKSLSGMGLFSFLASPIITLVATPLVARWVGRAQRSPRQRDYMVRFAWTIGILNTLCALVIGALSFNPSFIISHPVQFGVLLAATVVLNVGVTVYLSVSADRRLKQMRKEEQ